MCPKWVKSGQEIWTLIYLMIFKLSLDFPLVDFFLMYTAYSIPFLCLSL